MIRSMKFSDLFGSVTPTGNLGTALAAADLLHEENGEWYVDLGDIVDNPIGDKVLGKENVRKIDQIGDNIPLAGILSDLNPFSSAIDAAEQVAVDTIQGLLGLLYRIIFGIPMKIFATLLNEELDQMDPLLRPAIKPMRSSAIVDMFGNRFLTPKRSSPAVFVGVLSMNPFDNFRLVPNVGVHFGNFDDLDFFKSEGLTPITVGTVNSADAFSSVLIP